MLLATVNIQKDFRNGTNFIVLQTFELLSKKI